MPSFDEQVVHHMMVNVLQPVFMRGMYRHSYGSIPGRGGLRGKKAVERFIRRHPRECKYVLKMDIRKYFDSIPHDMLVRKLRETIHDKRLMAVLEEIIGVTDKGIPLGFYTSQWIANWYLQGLDHHIKEELGAAFYIRYMDDMVVFGANKRRLHRTREAVGEYLEKELGLEMKGNWQVFRFDYGGKYRPLDFMGYKFYRDRTVLRKSIMIKAARKAAKISRVERVSIFEARQMLSYLGWIKHTDTYGMYLERIKPLVSFRKLKRKVSRYDKNRRKKDAVVQSGERGIAA